MPNNDPDTVRDLIAWGKTLCLPTQSQVEWNVYCLASALETAQNLLERLTKTTPEHHA
jgi:hypothetical protein